jgi:TRAP-type C4-dicarboxylate transport system substrate-binding protein
MFRLLLRGTAMALLFWSGFAVADPIDLKFSFFTSDNSEIYQGSIKPFVDGVNADGRGLIHITVYFSGAISNSQPQQPQLVSEGKADLAYVVPGQTPERFADTAAMGLPGLFPDAATGSRVYLTLARNGTLTGYRDYYVIGANLAGPESIHSRKRISSLADLKGLTVRVNNPVEASVMQHLGAVPVLLPINKTTDAMSSGSIDAATFPPSMLFEFGIGRVATYHYMMKLGCVPLALVMNRQKFDSLPNEARAIIRKYSGDWLDDISAKNLDELDQRVLHELEADPRRTVVFPGAADEEKLRAVYTDVTDEYANMSNHNLDVLARARAELGKIDPGR